MGQSIKKRTQDESFFVLRPVRAEKFSKCISSNSLTSLLYHRFQKSFSVFWPHWLNKIFKNFNVKPLTPLDHNAIILYQLKSCIGSRSHLGNLRCHGQLVRKLQATLASFTEYLVAHFSGLPSVFAWQEWCFWHYGRVNY